MTFSNSDDPIEARSEPSRNLAVLCPAKSRRLSSLDRVPRLNVAKLSIAASATRAYRKIRIMAALMWCCDLDTSG